MVKTNYDFAAKRRSREIYRTFIEKNIKDLKSSRVICLPGNEALEITQVYDSLGISRNNIVGVERDKKVFNNLKELKLGIELFNGDIVEYFNNNNNNNNNKFDIVSIDSTQLPSNQYISLIRNLYANSILTGNSVLHTNFYSKRINEFVKEKMLYITSLERSNIIGKGRLDYIRINMKSHPFNAKVKDPNLSLKEFRSDALTSLLIMCSKPNESLLNLILGDSEYFWSSREKSKISNIKVLLKNVFYPIDTGGVDHKWNFSHDAFNPFFDAAFTNKKEEYLIKDLERFQYISNDGSLMFTDLLALTDCSNLLIAGRNCVKGMSMDNKSIIMNGVGYDYKKNKKIFEKCVSNYYQFFINKERLLIPINQPLRYNVSPPKLSKEKAIELIKKGWTNKMFSNNFSNYRKMQIAAFRAHITMGTYNEVNDNMDDKKNGFKNDVDRFPNINKTIKDITNLFDKGIVLYDSNPKRLEKNQSRINIGNYNLLSTCSIDDVLSIPGLSSLVKKTNGFFVFNSYDEKIEYAINVLLDHAIYSRYYHNLILLGDSPSFIKENIGIAKELGAKIRVYNVNLKSPFIPPQSPINLRGSLEELLKQ